MILFIFTIHDKKAEAYLPPFYLPQTGMAVRTFKDCVNDKSHTFSLHPEDYTLMAIGTFDDNSAIAMTTAPESIGNGLQYIEEEENVRQMELIRDDLEKQKLQEKLIRSNGEESSEFPHKEREFYTLDQAAEDHKK